MNTYAGIGSRRAPLPTLGFCESIARYLSRRGWLLRTGHAIGCDQAFEAGAGHRAQVFLPWKDYEENVEMEACSVFTVPTVEAMEMVVDIHPAPHRLSMAAIRLHARNCHIILGGLLNTPVSHVVCWTTDEDRGGTSFGLRLARAHGISVQNLARPEVREKWERAICGPGIANPV